MNTVVLAARGSYGVERPVVRLMTSVACGPEAEATTQTVATQTRREFAVTSSPRSSEDPELAGGEESMEEGGSSTEAVVGFGGASESAVSVVEPGASDVGSPLVIGTVPSTSRPDRAGN